MYGEDLNVYLCKVIHPEKEDVWLLVLARNVSEIEFAVTSDPDGYNVGCIQLIGIQNCNINSLATINATKFQAEAETSKGGYEGLCISELCRAH